jgi:mannosyltransferase
VLRHRFDFGYSPDFPVFAYPGAQQDYKRGTVLVRYMQSVQIINPLRSKKATHRAVFAVTWVAFLLRVITLDFQSLWRDEIDSRWLADGSYSKLFLQVFSDGHNGPLYFILLKPWIELTGASEFALRFPSAAMGSLAVPVGYVLVRQLGQSRRVGVLMAILLATSPYLAWYAQEVKMYATLTVVIALAVIAYLKALTGGRQRWWLVFVAATSVSFYLHILSPLMLPVYGGIALIYWPETRRKWRAWLVSMGCLTLPYLPLVIWQLPYLVNSYDSGHPFYPLREQTYLLFKLYSSGLVHFIGLTGIVLTVFLLLVGLFFKTKRTRENAPAQSKQNTPSQAATDWQPRLVLALWLMVPFFTIYFISLRVPVFEDRYLIYLTLPFYVLLAMGIALIRAHTRLLAALCLGLVLSINLLGIWQQQRTPIKADFRAAGRYLAAQQYQPTTVMIQTPYLRKTFDYYYGRPYRFVEGLWTNHDKTEAEVHREMLHLTAGLSDLWLVVSEEDLWDKRGLVRKWLDDNADQIDKAHFMRVDVYYYRFGAGNIDAPSVGTQ